MKIVGHRGAKNEAPENTMLGFNTAINAGVFSIEIDVHKTKDNKLVVIHDPTLNRTTNGEGIISELDYKQLLEFDAGQGEKIPLLEEVLSLCLQKNIYLFIESKVAHIEDDIAKLIKKHNAYDSCCVICFYHQFLKNIKEIDPNIETGCLTECAPIDPVTMVRNAGSNLLSISIKTINPELVSQCKKAGLKISVWNANTEAHFKKMQDLKVDYLCTDCPSLITPLNKKTNKG